MPATARAAAWYPEALARYGYLGVDLFFMLSGFVILLTADRPGMTWRRFVAARALRLYPAYIVCCLATAVVVWEQLPRDQVSPTTTLLGNLTMLPAQIGVQPLDPSYWSLVAELEFYLLIGLLLFLGALHRIEAVCWVALVLPLVLPVPLRPVAVAYAPMFVFGCACHLLRSNRHWRIVALLAAAGVLCIVQAVDMALLMQRYPRPAPEVIAGVLVACQALMVAVAMGWLRLPAWRWLAAAGAISYPLYLLHNTIGRQLLGRYLLDAMPPAAALASVAALVVAAAALVALVIEPRLKAAAVTRLPSGTCRGRARTPP